MQSGFYVGIDWGNERHAICVTTAAGEIIKERFVKNDETALKVLAELVGGAAAHRVHVAVETRRLALVDALVARGYAVFTINPRQLERFRERFGVAGAKDDRRDARVAAITLRTDPDCFRGVKGENDVHRRLRVALRGLEAADVAFRRAANQLREIVLIAMPVLLELCAGADERWFWKLAAKALRDVVPDAEIADILKKHRIRRFTVANVQAVLTSAHLFTSSTTRTSAAWSLEISVAQLEALMLQQSAYEAELTAALAIFPKPEGFDFSDADLILSVPGFGPKSAASLLVEASDCLASRDYHRLRAIVGVAAVTSSTGKKEMQKKGLVMMRRACSHRLRHTMHNVANVARIHDPRSRRTYVAAKQRGHGHARALRGVADRLLSYTIGVLRSGKPYDKNFGVAAVPPSAAIAEERGAGA